MTGFPVEDLAAFRAPAWVDAVERALDAVAASRAAAAALLKALSPLRGAQVRTWRRRIQQDRRLEPPVDDSLVPLVNGYHDALAAHLTARAAAATAHVRELERARGELYRHAAGERFRHVLLLSTSALETLTPDPAAPLPARNQHVREREHAFISYLQRLVTKNETVSFFGPSMWGTFEPGLAAPARIELDEPDVAERSVAFERWVCEALLEQMKSDPEAAPLLGWKDGDDLAVVLPYTHEPLAEVEALVAAWPEGSARDRWRERLAGLARLAGEVARATELEPRRRALAETRLALEGMGVGSTRSSRALYASRLPLVENCRRAARRVQIGPPVIEQLTVDLAPWYDLWRDLAGLYATELRARLLPLWQAPVPLPSFFAAAEQAGIRLAATGGVGVPGDLEARIQEAWQAEMGERLARRELALSEHDLGFLRRRFPHLRRMKAFDWPAPDVQIIARDADALARGEWQLLLGEIHPDFTPWTQALFMWCPAPARFAAAFAHPGHRAALEFTTEGPHYRSVHRFNRAPTAIADFTFVGAGGVAGRRRLPADQVTVHAEDDDLVARDPAGAFLGSLVHTWAVASSTHQLELVGTGPHSPRLRSGRVIVQRESWRLTPDEALKAALDAPEPEPSLALRALRREQGWPDEVFAKPQLPIRLTEHKATKPVFVDFRSPLLLPLLAEQLQRYRSIRVTEMLPRSEDNWLGDSRGHYSFEIRCAVIPG